MQLVRHDQPRDPAVAAKKDGVGVEEANVHPIVKLGDERVRPIIRGDALIAKFDDGVNVRFLNTNAIFLGRDGRIPWLIMPDQLHPTAAGYQLWAEAMQPLLTEMMK